MSTGGLFRDRPVLRVEAVTLARGERTLVREMSFSIGGGAFVEVRGANGSGKTSLLRAIAGYLRPRAGRIVFPNIAEPALAMHYVGHQNGLKPSATVRAHMLYWAGLFHGEAGAAAEALMRLGLERQRDLPARALSQGQARRLALARLVSVPRPIWLLDEPAAGLDEEGRAVLARLLLSHQAQGGLAIAALHEAIEIEPALVVKVGL